MKGEQLERYLDMLIQQSYTNEEKAGHYADSVGSKLESLKPQILSDRAIVENIKEMIDFDKRRISQGVGNKVDLIAEVPTVQWDDKTHIPIISLSASQGNGIQLLGETFKKILSITEHEPDFSARSRHVSALKQVLHHIQLGEKELGLSPPRLECIAEELRVAQNHLSEITGEFRSDDLLGKIFSTFCIGK